jgi:hypothetical protein
MKGILLIVAMVPSVISFAQKGNCYVGGVVGYASNTFKNASGFKTVSSSWAFAPEAGTFLKDDIQLGLALGLSGNSSKDDNGKIQTTSSLSPTVYMRKFFKVTDNFSMFTGLYLNFSNGKTTSYTSSPSVETKQSGVGVRLGVGVAYSLSPRFTAVGQYGLMGYQSTTTSVAGTKTGTDSSFDFGVNTVGSSTINQGNGSRSVFNIGLYYTFIKK